jgi:RNA polymerase sigma factor (sigma-70 family)
MSTTGSSQNFFIRLNDLHSSAMEELDRRFRERLCALVEKEMGKRFTAREDPEDAVQSAMASFCRRMQEQRFQIAKSNSLWALLVKVAREKMLQHVEYHNAEKREPDREVRSEDESLLSREPSPEDAVLVADIIEQAIKGLPEPDPEIFRFRLEGYTREEIARQFNLTEGTVRWKLDRIRDRLSRLLPPEASSSSKKVEDG